MSKWPIILATLFATLSGVLSGVFYNTASAASVYDDNYRTTDSLVVETASCNLVDMTMTWGGFISNKDNWTHTPAHYDTYYPMIYDAISNGAFAVSQVISGEPSNPSGYDPYKAIDIIFSTPNTPLIWSTRSIYTQSRSIRITTEFWNGASNCNLSVYMANTNLDNHVISNDVLPPITNLDSPMVYNFIAYEWQYNYPTAYGYDGPEIRESFTPPAPQLDWTPDVNMVHVVDWKITLQDRNFNTFDPVPFTCEQGLTPVIQYDLLNNDTSENLAQGVFSPTIPFEFQSEKYGIETEYKFIGNYYCDDGVNTFAYQTTYYFTVNAAGTYIPPTDSCYTDTFPFIDMNGCTGVLENFINNLSFGAITFPDWSINNDGCHTLGVIGDWLNVPSSSRTVCPQFSATVRNIVTPFLTFVLGITILGVITTKSRSDTH